MFWAQIFATVIGGTVQLGVQSWMFTNIPDMCSPTQKDGFICPSTEVFGTASIIWGVIGPQRQFSHGQIYYGTVFFFLIGAIAPCVAYAVSLKWPNSFIKYVNFPVIFAGTGLIPPASAVNYVPWTIVAFIFNYVIRRRHFSWWTKYNCAYPVRSWIHSHVLTLASHRHLVRWSRLRSRRVDHLHLLHPPVPQGWHDRRDEPDDLVGQHRQP